MGPGIIRWLGWIGGGFISVFLAPAMVVYPLIHWFVEGTWPVTFIIVFAVAFGVGAIGMAGWFVLMWKFDFD